MTIGRVAPVLHPPPAGGAVLASGVDLVDLRLLERMLVSGGQRYLDRIFTPAEQAHCAGRTPQLGTRLAAKEAMAKALGTGIRGIDWTDIEVHGTDIEVHSALTGQPGLQLHGPAREQAARLGLTLWSLSLSHEGEFAVAFVVGTGPGPLTPAPKEIL